MDRIDTNRSKAVVASLRAGTAPVSRAKPAPGAGSEVRSPSEAVAGSVASAGSQAPIDNDRVDEIRKAIEQGRYPINPAKIADAMIAAGFLLRIER